MTFPYDRSHLLTPSHAPFERDLEHFVVGLYESDTLFGDSTMEALAQYDRPVRALVTAKSPGIFCGRPMVSWLLRWLHSSLEVQFEGIDGWVFQADDVLLSLSGSAAEILKIERTLLNVLQRLSGIATLTRRYVDAATPCPIASTRKTLWGLLDKYAVSVGGGLTHRLNLGDAVMLKENHLALLPEGIGSLTSLFPYFSKDLPFVTVEVERPDQIDRLLTACPSLPFPLFILCDNFSSESLRDVLLNLKRPPGVYFEASGGITLENLSDYATTGVDVLSIGAITHSVPASDFSLRLSQ